jgi:ketosteroid isomerase-like protein
MSEENVEVVRRIYERGLLDQGPEPFLALATPDVEWVNPPEAVDPGTRHGKAEVAQAVRNMTESFDAQRHELHQVFDAGDTVVAWVSFRTRSRGSDTEVVQREAHTWTLRDGMVARYEWGRDLGEALRAAGLEE